MEIILFIIVVSLLFPGSSGGGHFEFMMIPVVIICAALLLAVFVGPLYLSAWAVDALGIDPWWCIPMWFGSIMAILLTNKIVCERIDRRKALRTQTTTI